MKKSATDDLVVPGAAAVTTEDLPLKSTPTPPAKDDDMAPGAASASEEGCTPPVADLRAEGVTAAEASDAASSCCSTKRRASIDRVTGWFFELRLLTLHLSGRGAPSIELPDRRPRVDRLLLGSAELSLDPSELLIVGAPVQPGFDARASRAATDACSRAATATWWPRGSGTSPEDDGTPTGRTPPAIRPRRCSSSFAPWRRFADDASFEARSRWRIIEERTRDQSYRLDPRRLRRRRASPATWRSGCAPCALREAHALGRRDARSTIFPFIAELHRPRHAGDGA